MKILKWVGIILALIVLVLFVFFKIMTGKADDRLEKNYELGTPLIAVPTDSVSLERGRHLANVLCMECHGYNFEGKHFFNEEGLASVYSHNLTSGIGGIGSKYTDQDWIRSIRRGVNPSGKAIFVMPSAEFNMLCDADLGSIIAYIKSLPPVDNEVPAPVYENFGKFLLGSGAFGPNIINAEIIDHQKAAEPCQDFVNTVDHGKYLVAISGCYGCHGPQLNGAKTPKPGSPFASNLTGGGNLASWSSEDFIRLMRSGVTKEGKSLDNYYMPWKAYGNYNDEELAAMFDFLKSLEALPTAEGG